MEIPQGAQEVSGVDDIVRAVRSQIAAGADVVKFYADYRWGPGEPSRATLSAAELKAGTVWVNTYGFTDVRLPWGGSGDSGFGREHGDVAIENFTEPKAVWVALTP